MLDANVFYKTTFCDVQIKFTFWKNLSLNAHFKGK